QCGPDWPTFGHCLLAGSALPTHDPTCLTSTDLPLYAKLESRAITNSQRIRDNPAVMSSTIPSAKYSCSGSPLKFLKGSTAIEGLSGRARAALAVARAAAS